MVPEQVRQGIQNVYSLGGHVDVKQGGRLGCQG